MLKDVETAPIETTEAEAEFDRQLVADPVGSREAEARLKDILISRDVKFGGAELPTSIKPLFVPQNSQAHWVGRVEAFLALLERVIGEHAHDREFFRYLKISEAAGDLCEIDPGYPRIAATCRPDALFTEDSVSLLEINADSPAMMTCADYVEIIQRELYPMAGIADGFGIASGMQRTPALLRAMLDAYRAWGGRLSSPTIAIVDWHDESTLEEQRLTAAAFTDRGCPSFVCDPRDLKIENNQLRAHGRTIDIVQRRVLFPDFVQRADEMAPLVTAYRERYACVVNPLRSILIGHKATMAWIEEMIPSLSPEDAKLVGEVLPLTRVLSSMNEKQLIEERTKWVLKPTDGHGGRGVMIGAATKPAAWKEALRVASPKWIVQEFRRPIRYTLPTFPGVGPAATTQLGPYFANWNPFFFGGKFGGAIARASTEPVVNIRAGGALLPVIAV